MEKAQQNELEAITDMFNKCVFLLRAQQPPAAAHLLHPLATAGEMHGPVAVDRCHRAKDARGLPAHVSVHRPPAPCRPSALRRMTDQCFRKCVALYKDENLSVGEATCVDRCVHKCVELTNS